MVLKLDNIPMDPSEPAVEKVEADRMEITQSGHVCFVKDHVFIGSSRVVKVVSPDAYSIITEDEGDDERTKSQIREGIS